MLSIQDISVPSFILFLSCAIPQKMIIHKDKSFGFIYDLNYWRSFNNSLDIVPHRFLSRNRLVILIDVSQQFTLACVLYTHSHTHTHASEHIHFFYNACRIHKKSLKNLIACAIHNFAQSTLLSRNKYVLTSFFIYFADSVLTSFQHYVC